jgi:hypothetical protein
MWLKYSALEAYYSAGYAPLKRVVKIKGNDSTGKGQCKKAPPIGKGTLMLTSDTDHVGLIKHPTGNPSNVVKEGYQPSGIDEGLIFGGLFIEKGSRVTRK